MQQQQQLGKYTVIRRLGVGGMAEVFLCRLVGIGGFEKHVVIKKIKEDIATDDEFITMFFDEARLAANLNHPNIIQVFEVDQMAGSPYLAMEYVRGATLSMVLQKLRAAKQSMPFGHVAHIFAGVCAGLEHAHNAIDASGRPLNIVHRDISPQNIIVSVDGTPKIFDFGVAKARGSLSLTGVDRVKGKFAYMAPEQLRAKPVDAKADIFAVGVCMYEAVTGLRPFRGSTEAELFASRVNGRFQMPSELAPTIPVELEHLILSAMAPDPADRPSAAELQEALATFCAVGTAHVSSAVSLAAWLKDIVGEQSEGYETYSSAPSVTPLPRSSNLPASRGAVEASRRGFARINGVIAVLGLAAVVLGATLALILVKKGRSEAPASATAAAPPSFPTRSSPHDDTIRTLLETAQQSLAQKDYAMARDALTKAAALDTTNADLALVRNGLIHRLEIEQIRNDLQEAKRGDDAPAAAAAAAAVAPAFTVEVDKGEAKGDRAAGRKKVAPTRVAVAAPKSNGASLTKGNGSRADSASVLQVAKGNGSAAPLAGSASGAGSGAGGGIGSAHVATQVAPAAAAPPVAASSAPQAGSAAPARITATPAPSPLQVTGPGTLDAVPTFSKLSVDGSLTTTEVTSALSRTIDTLRSCYRAAAKRANQTPELSIKINFEIDEGARASDVRVIGDSLGLGACARDAIGGLRTRVAPDVGTVSVSAVVRFKPTR